MPEQAIDQNKTYVGDVLARLNAKLPDLDPHLLELYALLVLRRGILTSLEDVHDAWAVWRHANQPYHKSMVPFDELSPEVQEMDRPYKEAIIRVAFDIFG